MKRTPIFAGRRKPLLAAALGMGFSQASLTVGTFGLFVYPLALAFAWSRTEISLGLTFATLALALGTPLAGMLVDRFGPVRILFASAGLFAMAFASLGLQSGGLFEFYALCVLSALLGAGTNAMTHTSVIAARYQDRLGLALGLALAGVGVISAVLPPLVQWFILHTGWRSGYFVLAVLCCAVSWPVAWHYHRLLRTQVGDSVGAPKASQRAPSVPLARLSRDRNFLVLVALFLTVSAGFTATNIHLVPILLTRGVQAQTAALFAGLIGVGLVIGRVVAGALMDRYFAPRVALWLFLMTALGMLCLSQNPPTPLLALASLSLGLGAAAELDLMAYLTARYFGQADYGKIYGIFYACFMVGAAAGPLLMGMGYDRFEGYDIPLLLNVAVLLLATLLTLLLGPYVRPEGETGLAAS